MEHTLKIATGRYLQGRGMLEKAGAEIAVLGEHALVIGGNRALAAVGGKLSESLKKANITRTVHRTDGFCTRERIASLALQAISDKCDVVVGVGGGISMDIAKGVADANALPIVTLPTIAATCAALTPFSVLYDEQGRSAGSKYYQHSVNVCIADIAAIEKAPARTLAAGILDSLAKSVEIASGQAALRLSDCGAGVYTAYMLGQHIKEILFEIGPAAWEAARRGKPDVAIDDAVFAILAVTGACSGFAEGSRQLAIAHSFNSAARTLFTAQANRFLHGETVAVGILIQILFNGAPDADRYAALMRSFGMPDSIAALGIAPSKENIAAIRGYIAGAMGDKFDEKARERLLDALRKIGD